jgi:predicted DCC family thiol-disulfide oxidoreductase YuxK
MMPTQNDPPLILYDGACSLCNRSVNFIAARDPHNLFRFLPLQSNQGQQLMRNHHLNPKDLSTVILIDKGHVYTRSTAVLRILRQLNRPEAWLILAIPRPMRDIVYNWIARNRYRWFGDNKSKACPIKTQQR